MQDSNEYEYIRCDLHSSNSSNKSWRFEYLKVIWIVHKEQVSYSKLKE